MAWSAETLVPLIGSTGILVVSVSMAISRRRHRKAALARKSRLEALERKLSSGRLTRRERRELRELLREQGIEVDPDTTSATETANQLRWAIDAGLEAIDIDLDSDLDDE